MPEALSPEIQRMVARFGGAAVAAGLLTPAVRFPEMVVGCNRLVIDAEIRLSYWAVANDDGIAS